MSGRLVLLISVIVAFGILSALALMDVGYFGILEPHFKSYGEGQVLADLVIMCLMGCVWMTYDSRASGLPAWPFVIITIFLGSFGPLFYLLLRELRVVAPAVPGRAT